MKKGQKLPREPRTGLKGKALREAGFLGPDGKLKTSLLPPDCNRFGREVPRLFGHKDGRYFAEEVANHIPHLKKVLAPNGSVLFWATHANSGDPTFKQKTLAHRTTGKGAMTKPSGQGAITETDVATLDPIAPLFTIVNASDDVPLPALLPPVKR